MSTAAKYWTVMGWGIAAVFSSIGHAHDHRDIVKASTESEVAQAIQSANASGKPLVIWLAPGRYELVLGFDSEYGASRFPPVTGTVSIASSKVQGAVLDGAGMRVFTVKPGGHLSLRGLTIQNSYAICNDFECDQSGGGAAINVEGTLSLERCALNGNASFHAEGRGLTLGGAILSIGGHLSLADSTLEGNGALGKGGAIAIVGGTASLRHSMIRGNSLHGAIGDGGSLYGGGLYVSQATVSIVDTTFSANSASEPFDNWSGFGGAIFNTGGDLIIRNSSFIENVAYPYGSGGAIYNGGHIWLESSTIGGNSAGTLGGGIFNGGTLVLRSVTVARNEVLGNTLGGMFGDPSYPPGCVRDTTPELCISRGGGLWNEAGAVVVTRDSVFADNHKDLSEPSDCSGELRSSGRNAIGTDADCTLGRSGHSRRDPDLINIDARLGELEDNGQPGDAHIPLFADSPLIDAGGKVGERCLRRDQIGQPRTDGDRDGQIRCDIGAMEFQPTQSER